MKQEDVLQLEVQKLNEKLDEVLSEIDYILNRINGSCNDCSCSRYGDGIEYR